MKTGIKNPGVRTKLFVANETIGVGKIYLLQLVRDTGSISAAARQMGMSYRRAWFLLDSMQSGFESPLFETERGGNKRGGARLTSLGVELLNRYTAHASLIACQSSEILDWLGSVQSHQPTKTSADFRKQKAKSKF